MCDGQSPQKIKDLGALQIVCWIFDTNVGAGLGHDLSQFVTSNIGNRIGDELVQIAPDWQRREAGHWIQKWS